MKIIKIKEIFFFVLPSILLLIGCNSNGKSEKLSQQEKKSIQNSIQKEIDIMIQAVSNKDIDTYMKGMPEDFIIYDENGEIITRLKQKEYALRDWAIIEKTLNNEMKIDSIGFMAPDSVYVYTSQRWERIMFQRDGITKDTVITSQLHKELWKNRKNRWIGYDVEELGGEIFINGKKYDPN
ncbi:hypothetical protein [Namhaeicola litoreus]|uniref:DUF4440 domain-containing protein n=1 Tax=Namhaeicola litoreus TaxID=1052145 RepID=A0ABW3XZI6_9FLAO